ncbi:hypothetical protein [Paraburkholderia caribensis]|uniref:hypothetical protein n=1 Tax=Paraburkholderia caribensis TaxID=75105 RepID=UPI0020900368|nr:hypothetical protein [Paraburkholderia caribensis]MCO4880239.1 hypothetical protein [Paraburkholderia caribensis]
MAGIFDDPQTPLADALKTGVETISYNQSVTFTLYKKYILPVDGYVFWIKQYDSTGAPVTMEVKGSLHYVTEQNQRVDESVAINHMIFTAEQEIQGFQTVEPTTTWIGVPDISKDPNAGEILFAFNQRGSYYQQAGLHHYTGTAVYATFRTQILDSADEIPTFAILSNSIPLFMALTGTTDIRYPYPAFLASNSFEVHPEFLNPENTQPPYITIEVLGTESLQVVAGPYTEATSGGHVSTRAQLCTDMVRIHLWGFDNLRATQYLDYLMAYMQDYGDAENAMGLVDSMPVIRDTPKTQSELGIRAQKKVIDLKVSYYQSAALAGALKLIEHTRISFDIGTQDQDVVFDGRIVPPDPFSIN